MSRIVKTLTCAKNEAVVINGEVVVTVIDILNKKVVLAVDAPEWVEVFPEEASEVAETIPPRPC
jgi:carbon storage regulator CsrA